MTDEQKNAFVTSGLRDCPKCGTPNSIGAVTRIRKCLDSDRYILTLGCYKPLCDCILRVYFNVDDVKMMTHEEASTSPKYATGRGTRL